ncbi:NuA4 domain containing protein [Trichuris trichiura]|uniref:Chromatin modification-related protein MEAF6 n=1 Tax=Trichuris trichiura TaxID=36087 RepID=A0A077Z3J4_TRITR|nr:NuA4 domain containing protein [Trichuris trichiura]
MSAISKKDFASAFASAQLNVEKARRYLQRKQAALAEAERQVYEKEENYLAEFEHIGTVITGFHPISEFRSSNGPDSKGSRARKRRHSVSDANRLFSWASFSSGVEIDEAQLAAFKKKESEAKSDNSDVEDDETQDKNFT